MMPSATPMLSRETARALTDEVKGDALALWAKLLALYGGGAHTVLGYASWAAYCAAEFEMSDASSYRLLQAARVVAQLPMGSPLPANERQARELARLPDPDAQREVWSEVVTAQPDPKQRTAATVREAVNRHPAAPAPRVTTSRADSQDWGDAPDSGAYYDEPAVCADCRAAVCECEAAPSPSPEPPRVPEPFYLPPAHLSKAQQAFYDLTQCVHVMNHDPAAVAATAKPDALEWHVGQLEALAIWLPQLVDALRARQAHPGLRAVK